MKYTEKPDTPQQVVLAHYGVQGMKWGVRTKKSTTSEIKDARARQGSRQREFVRSIDTLNRVSAGTNKKATDTAAKKAVKIQKEFLTSEDRVVAARATKGEKIAHVLLLGPGALVTLPLNKVHEKAVEKSVDKARKNS